MAYFSQQYLSPSYFQPDYFLLGLQAEEEVVSGGRPRVTRISLDRPVDEIIEQLLREDEEVVVVLVAAHKLGII